jgi:hypothetical protein
VTWPMLLACRILSVCTPVRPMFDDLLRRSSIVRQLEACSVVGCFCGELKGEDYRNDLIMIEGDVGPFRSPQP